MAVIAICISILSLVLALLLCVTVYKALSIVVKVKFKTTVRKIIDEYEETVQRL